MRSVLQVCADFTEEHADSKVTKKWVNTTVKEIAERDNGQWSVTAQALADAGKRGHASMLSDGLFSAMSTLTAACLAQACSRSVFSMLPIQTWAQSRGHVHHSFLATCLDFRPGMHVNRTLQDTTYPTAP